jgi:hypothetical protein
MRTDCGEATGIPDNARKEEYMAKQAETERRSV